MSKKKISIVGAGNAGCISLLGLHLMGMGEKFELELYYDSNVPIEQTGQGTTLSVVNLLADSLGIYHKDNPIKTTVKTGINYENWGKKNHNFFHSFPLSRTSCHYVPSLLSDVVKKSNIATVIEKNITDPESEIDSDYIVDCRGRSENNYEEYYKIVNPLNSVILARKETPDYSLQYTRCVATPNGWTFIIPNHDSVSYGYLYNDTITTDDDARNNFIEMFDVQPGEKISFKNYLAKSMWQGERTILNGNKFCFIEPLEATSTTLYYNVIKQAYSHIVGGIPKEVCNHMIMRDVKNIETFVLWHYQNGSKFDTPFWDYAKSLEFKPNSDFYNYLNSSLVVDYKDLPFSGIMSQEYTMWPIYSFKNWSDNVIV